MGLTDALLLDPYYPLDYYVSARADNVGGSGTINDPLNGSTADRFDKLMRDVIPANARIHLGPGIFTTQGYYDGAAPSYGWQLKPGWKISGSGIDVTKLQLISSTTGSVHFVAIGHPLSVGGVANPVDFCEISDLTVDCALSDTSNTGTSAFGAIRVMGNHVRVQRVKAIRWGTKTSSKPCFVIAIITADRSAGLVEMLDPGIEGCMAVEPDAAGSNVGPATAFHAGGKEDAASSAEGVGIGPFIRNCFVDCVSPTATPEYRGLSMSWCKGGIIEGNQVHNTKHGGPYQDKASTREVIVRNNMFKNCFKAPYWNLGTLSPSIGTASLSRAGSVATVTFSSNHNLSVGDRVKIDTTPNSFNGFYAITGVTSTTFTFSTSVTTDTSATVNSALKVFGVDKLLVEGNIIEMAPQTSPSGDVIGVFIHDNSLAGQNPTYPAYVHGEVVIRDNKFRYLNSAFSTLYIGYGIQVNGAKKVIVHGNVVEAAPANPIQNLRCGAVTYFHNDTPAGALIQGYDGANKYSELETEGEDALLLTLI